MEVTLSRKDLINLIKGTTPYYSVQGDPIVSASGYFTGGFHDKWTWSGFSDTLTEKELWNTYILCRDSWK